MRFQISMQQIFDSYVTYSTKILHMHCTDTYTYTSCLLTLTLYRSFGIEKNNTHSTIGTKHCYGLLLYCIQPDASAPSITILTDATNESKQKQKAIVPSGSIHAICLAARPVNHRHQFMGSSNWSNRTSADLCVTRIALWDGSGASPQQ